MKPIKLFLIFIVILLILLMITSIVGCSQGSQESQNQSERKEDITETQDQVKQQEIDKYWEEFKEWMIYSDEYTENVSPLIEDLIELADKRVEASRSGDNDKANSYLEVEEDKSEEVVNALYDLYVPKVVINYHDCLTNSYIKHKQWCEYMNKSARELESGIADWRKSL
jgi:hypothetical protein